jgi:hypothetical protein
VKERTFEAFDFLVAVLPSIGKLDVEIEEYKNPEGFELIANALNIPCPSRM